MSPTILLTGGTGYIGSHASLVLLQAGFDLVVLDNLCSSSMAALNRVDQITGKAPNFVRGDVRDEALLHRLFAKHEFVAVLHFAGLKSVAESAQDPLSYYDNNVLGTLRLIQAAARAGVFRFVFSSSATVYGTQPVMPYVENMPVGMPANPYGRTKLIVEQMLSDMAAADPRWHVALLRYFNPVGAHESGLIGEDPRGVPNNLMPYVCQVAVGRRPELQVFGNDYPTRDGTGVRDYIHVMDLAEGHVKALQALDAMGPGAHVWNLGTGHGVSVLEMVRAFEQVSGKHVPYRVVARRPGDIAECWADPSKAERELGWKARRTLHDMVADAWRWQSRNPNGYASDKDQPE